MAKDSIQNILLGTTHKEEFITKGVDDQVNLKMGQLGYTKAFFEQHWQEHYRYLKDADWQEYLRGALGIQNLMKISRKTVVQDIQPQIDAAIELCAKCLKSMKINYRKWNISAGFGEEYPIDAEEAGELSVEDLTDKYKINRPFVQYGLLPIRQLRDRLIEAKFQLTWLEYSWNLICALFELLVQEITKYHAILDHFGYYQFQGGKLFGSKLLGNFQPPSSGGEQTSMGSFFLHASYYLGLLLKSLGVAGRSQNAHFTKLQESATGFRAAVRRERTEFLSQVKEMADSFAGQWKLKEQASRAEIDAINAKIDTIATYASYADKALSQPFIKDPLVRFSSKSIDAIKKVGARVRDTKTSWKQMKDAIYELEYEAPEAIEEITEVVKEAPAPRGVLTMKEGRVVFRDGPDDGASTRFKDLELDSDGRLKLVPFVEEEKEPDPKSIQTYVQSDARTHLTEQFALLNEKAKSVLESDNPTSQRLVDSFFTVFSEIAHKAIDPTHALSISAIARAAATIYYHEELFEHQIEAVEAGQVAKKVEQIGARLEELKVGQRWRNALKETAEARDKLLSSMSLLFAEAVFNEQENGAQWLGKLLGDALRKKSYLPKSSRGGNKKKLFVNAVIKKLQKNEEVQRRFEDIPFNLAHILPGNWPVDDEADVDGTDGLMKKKVQDEEEYYAPLFMVFYQMGSIKVLTEMIFGMLGFDGGDDWRSYFGLPLTLTDRPKQIAPMQVMEKVLLNAQYGPEKGSWGPESAKRMWELMTDVTKKDLEAVMKDFTYDKFAVPLSEGLFPTDYKQSVLYQSLSRIRAELAEPEEDPLPDYAHPSVSPVKIVFGVPPQFS